MLKKGIVFKIIYCTIAALFLSSMSFVSAAESEGVFYEIFVRSFYDSNGDGIGDFKGLTEKLDYLNDGNPNTERELGIKGIWLMPILESSSYHGYDVIDYYRVESDYGTEEDLRKFLAEAHKRGIKVIMDLVLNHTSSRHPWFLDASEAKADWYIWKDAMPNGWTRPWGGVAPEDVWHRRGEFYYYGAFGAGMPDLNYNNEEVVAEMKKVIKFWLNKGIDGFRLDGARYLAEKGGGVLNQADSDQTHRVLRTLAAYAKSINKDSILIGEVWAGNDIVGKYYGEGNELTHAFNFDLAGAIINSIKSNDYRGIEDTLNKMAKYNAPVNFYSPFLTNHDQNRVALELNANPDKLKLAASLLLSMQGTPFIYYGEEIGMTGDGAHERIRTPMQWDDTENGGFTKGKPWEKLQDNFKEINVKSEGASPHSLLNYYKKLIRIRNKYQRIFNEGERKLVMTDSSKIYAYLYADDAESLLFIHNFNDEPVGEIKLGIYDAGLKGGRYKVINLLNSNKKMEDVTDGNSREYSVSSLGRYESLVLELMMK